MVLIITSSDDISTNKVIEWLVSLNVPFIRFNDITEIIVDKIVLDYSMSAEFTLTVKDGVIQRCIKYSEITSVWYRRGSLQIYLPSDEYFISNNEKYRGIFSELMSREVNPILNFIVKLLSYKAHINSYSDNFTNKLNNLYLAQFVGINIPSTFVSQSRDALKSKLSASNEEYISKSIADFQFIIHRNEYKTPSHQTIENRNLIATKTELISNDTFPWQNFEEVLFPSLIQKKVEKLFELRIFFLFEDYYPMAIFSQDDPKTKLDFRNYNHEDPNRTVPFLLPDTLKHKLVRLMGLIGLNSGSIDMIYTTDRDFVFLEINPVGQFNQVSYPCNYYIEEKIARFFYNKHSANG